jgi:hypothetical protein
MSQETALWWSVTREWWCRSHHWLTRKFSAYENIQPTGAYPQPRATVLRLLPYLRPENFGALTWSGHNLPSAVKNQMANKIHSKNKHSGSAASALEPFERWL